MKLDIDNFDAALAWAIGVVKHRGHNQTIAPGPVDDEMLLRRYAGTTALVQLGNVMALCDGCGVLVCARMPVGARTEEGFAGIPGARVVPPAGWQEGSATQRTLCPLCLVPACLVPA